MLSKTKHHSQLQEQINLLHHLYKPISLSNAFYSSKVNAIETLDQILKSTTRKALQDVVFKELLECALTLVYFFGMRLRIRKLQTKYCPLLIWKRKFEKAEQVFQKTMHMLLPERSDTAIKITLQFCNDAALWPYENFVVQIFEVILYFNSSTMTVFNMILTDIHYVLFTDVKSSRHRVRVMYELLNSENLTVNKHKLLPFVTRLLDFFAHSLVKKDRPVMGFKYLRKGFEVCLIRIFRRALNEDRLLIITTMLNWFSMVRMNDEEILEFSVLISHAAELYTVSSYSDSFSKSLINHVLKHLVGSENALTSLVGFDLLQKFFDRNSNANNLLNPTIYYDFSEVPLIVTTYHSGDKAFLQFHREKIQIFFMRACKMHCHSVVNLKALYRVVCIIILEVPCGLSAAAAAWIAMTIQDYALNAENLALASRYWMHALVICIMSLISWVHKAPVLYDYVNRIISRRSKDAPQLNPPLKPVYEVNQHHVTWNKPSLFLEDWELRYAMWKHFQGQSESSKGKNTKIPGLEMV